MTNLETLSNPSRPAKRRKRVGRGIGTGMGKTSGRGHKGAGARSGYKRRHGYQGGSLRLFQALPIRGFTRGRHLRRLDSVNLSQIEREFADGEVVSVETLRKHGFVSGQTHGVKILGKGELTKKIEAFEGVKMSASAKEKIEKAGVTIR